MKNVAIVGAGPGGLLAGIILQSSGYNVTIYEKNRQIGGRTSKVTVGQANFTAGPTFLGNIKVLEDILSECNINLSDYVEYEKLEHSYDIFVNQEKYSVTSDVKQNAKMYLEKFGKGYDDKYLEFIKDNEIKYAKIEKILMQDFSYVKKFFTADFKELLKVLRPTKSLDQDLEKYFQAKNARRVVQFQSKYLGMSPYEAPSMFTILGYMDHALGIYYVKGGLHNLMEALATIFKDKNGKIILNQDVTKVENLQNDQMQLIINGISKKYDHIVVNGDISKLVNQDVMVLKQRKYQKQNIPKLKFSCSTIVYYAELNEKLDLPMHTIILSDDYDEYLSSIENSKFAIDDVSLYLNYDVKNNAKGIYILVPVGNTKYQQEIDERILLEKINEKLIQHLNLDLIKNINQYFVNTPQTWEENYHHLYGANFNFGHQIRQMLYFRPHNIVKNYNSLYLVGGGTHPGSGLPTIFASAIISAKMIKQKDNN